MEKKELKIVSLNTWGGKIKQSILDFFENNQDIDIFCLQEVFNNIPQYLIDERPEIIESKNLFSDIENSLLDYKSFFKPAVDNFYGLSMSVKKDLFILKEGDIYIYESSVYKNSINRIRKMQYISLKIDERQINILNFHGLWTGGGKEDTEDRIKQSQNIIDFLKTLEGEIILCGDFNLKPETESIKIIEDYGLRNLIKENNITSTRTSHYTKPEKFADYTFVSKGIEVKSFEIMPDEISDHSPMKLIVSI